MAYIRPEQVAEMRNEIKKLCPSKEGWKVSVTTENYSTVRVRLLQGPLDFGTTYRGVNHYYIDKHYSGKQKDILEAIKKITHKNWYDNSDAMTDYFDTAWYVDISIGRCDRIFS